MFFGGGGLLAGVSAVFLMGLLGAMLLPSVPERAQAVEGDGGATTYATGASVSLGVPATIDFEAVTPTANGATTTATANVTVATTNSAGYSLYLYAEGGNNLVAQNPATAEVVTATASSATLDGLANNTWGYNLGTATPGTGTTYAAVPTDGTTPVQTKDTSSTNAANDTYTLALGAKVDTTIPSGTYTGALTVAVVAEPGGIVINYDANGGYFNNDPGRTSNEVLYNVEELETQSINEPSLSANYDKTITIPGATSLVVSFSCNVIAIGGSTIYLYDGSGKAVASCTYGPTTGPDQSNPNTTSGTYIILGDTFSVVANYGRLAASLQATAVGYSITTTAGTEELIPTRSGYSFAGWYTDAAGTEGNEFVPNGNMVSGTTVYAKWEEVLAMQGFTNSQCQSLASDAPYTVRDSRDNNTYTVRYINGACWMTQNLRLSGGRTLTSADSNITSTWDFPNNNLSEGSSLTEAMWAANGNEEYGNYYNFCAASAGTVCQNNDPSDSDVDICPVGWRLPTISELAAISVTDFSPVPSGYYGATITGVGQYGYWWSSNGNGMSEPDYQRILVYTVSSGTQSSSVSFKSDGYSVRCISTSNG